MIRRVLWTHLLSKYLIVCTCHGNKYPRSADTSELYLVIENHEKSQGKSLISYPQSEVIHLRPTSELVTPVVGTCFCSQMSTVECILNITEWQKYERHHEVAEITERQHGAVEIREWHHQVIA
jgi:hypothetical protein